MLIPRSFSNRLTEVPGSPPPPSEYPVDRICTLETGKLRNSVPSASYFLTGIIEHEHVLKNLEPDTTDNCLLEGKISDLDMQNSSRLFNDDQSDRKFDKQDGTTARCPSREHSASVTYEKWDDENKEHVCPLDFPIDEDPSEDQPGLPMLQDTDFRQKLREIMSKYDYIPYTFAETPSSADREKNPFPVAGEPESASDIDVSTEMIYAYPENNVPRPLVTAEEADSKSQLCRHNHGIHCQILLKTHNELFSKEAEEMEGTGQSGRVMQNLSNTMDESIGTARGYEKDTQNCQALTLDSNENASSDINSLIDLDTGEIEDGTQSKREVHDNELRDAQNISFLKETGNETHLQPVEETKTDILQNKNQYCDQVKSQIRSQELVGRNDLNTDDESDNQLLDPSIQCTPIQGNDNNTLLLKDSICIIKQLQFLNDSGETAEETDEKQFFESSKETLDFDIHNPVEKQSEEEQHTIEKETCGKFEQTYANAADVLRDEITENPPFLKVAKVKEVRFKDTKNHDEEPTDSCLERLPSKLEESQPHCYDDEIVLDAPLNDDKRRKESPPKTKVSDEVKWMESENDSKHLIFPEHSSSSFTYTEEKRTVSRPRNKFTKFFRSFKRKLVKKV